MKSARTLIEGCTCRDVVEVLKGIKVGDTDNTFERLAKP